MAIVTSSYRPKRAPRKKRKGPVIVSRIVTPAPLKPIRGPVIRLGTASQQWDAEPKRSAIVEPKRKRSSVFGAAPDMTPEEHQRRGDAGDVLFREIVRRANSEQD